MNCVRILPFKKELTMADWFCRLYRPAEEKRAPSAMHTAGR